MQVSARCPATILPRFAKRCSCRRPAQLGGPSVDDRRDRQAQRACCHWQSPIVISKPISTTASFDGTEQHQLADCSRRDRRTSDQFAAALPGLLAARRETDRVIARGQPQFDFGQGPLAQSTAGSRPPPSSRSIIGYIDRLGLMSRIQCCLQRRGAHDADRQVGFSRPTPRNRRRSVARCTLQLDFGDRAQQGRQRRPRSRRPSAFVQRPQGGQFELRQSLALGQFARAAGILVLESRMRRRGQGVAPGVADSLGRTWTPGC